jgi:hypothetical protein
MSLVWRPGFNFDTDASAYIDAVEVADGQALETATRYAINNFVIGCKQDGIWDAIKASCILAGARTLAGALVPLVGAAPTNFNFLSGDYNRKTGLVGDGTTKFIATGTTQQSQQLNNNHLSVYVSSAHASVDTAMYLGGDGHDIYRAGADFKIRNMRPSGTGSTYSGLGGNTGFAGSSRNLASSYLTRFNGTNITVSETSNSGNSDITLFKRGSGTPLFTNARLAFYSIGESLDLALLDARVTDLINAIAAAIP